MLSSPAPVVRLQQRSHYFKNQHFCFPGESQHAFLIPPLCAFATTSAHRSAVWQQEVALRRTPFVAARAPLRRNKTSESWAPVDAAPSLVF